MKRLLLLPSVILYSLVLAAVVVAAATSLFSTNIIHTEWVGLANYAEIFRDPDIRARLVNSFAYAGLLVPGQAGLSLLIALTIFEVHKSMRSAVMFALYLPTFTAGIIISTVWRWIFHPQVGLVNWLLGTHVMWMGYRGTAILGISLVLVTCNLGLYTLIYMAALLQIGRDVLDAARIDGAGPLAVRLYIMLPMIVPTIQLTTLLTAIGAFQVWETIYMMSPVLSATNLMYDMFHTAFRAGRYGLGSAKAIVLMLLIAGLSAIKRRLER